VYGKLGRGANHSVEFRDLTVDKMLPDNRSARQTQYPISGLNHDVC
jgi:hypothetical protein